MEKQEDYNPNMNSNNLINVSSGNISSGGKSIKKSSHQMQCK